jgi:hypothetical protein
MKKLLQLAVLGATVAIAQPALAAKALVCHKGKQTLHIAQSAVPAHVGHGDTRGACQVVPPPPLTVVLLRCDSLDGDIVLQSASASDIPEVPVLLPIVDGDNCATAVARLLNGGWELEFVTSGAALTPAEGESGFVTEYTFVSDDEDADDDDDEDEDEDD